MAGADGIFIGRGQGSRSRRLPLAPRHGLIAGAAGTGRTVTLQVLAEGFSAAGVPVFAADPRGVLSGLAEAARPDLQVRARADGRPCIRPAAFPVTLLDPLGEQGVPLRTTVSELGPLVLARLFGLNDTQARVLERAFALADERGWLLLDLKDLRALLHFMSENTRELSGACGRVGAATIGAIQRRVSTLEQQGGAQVFGEPAFRIEDLIRTDPSGRGIISILAAEQLILTPKLYAACLLWLLAELLESLPEVGEVDRPRLVFCIEEAHLVFDEAPKVLRERIERVLRLIRAKGVGIWFVSRSPSDLPDPVLAQLGYRIQHASRAATPGDRKAVPAAAGAPGPGSRLAAAEAITRLGIGEALISMLDAEGRPSSPERVSIRLPASRVGPLDPGARRRLIEADPLWTRYALPLDRPSASETLRERASAAARGGGGSSASGGRTASPSRGGRQTAFQAAAKSFARSVGAQIGRQIGRGLLGAMRR